MFISISVYADDEVKCYECSTHDGDQYCADPLNKTHPDLRTMACNGMCAKWTRFTEQGIGYPSYQNVLLKSIVNLMCWL